jgi:type IV secretion system protein TrbL
MMMVIIEFHASVMISTVLLPFAVFTHTAFFGEFALGWLTGCLVRTFVTAAVMAIAVPLFELLGVATTPGGDPTFYSAVVTALTSVVFAILSWAIPGRAATIAGRGMALGVHGGTLVSSMAGSARTVVMAASMVRGVSMMLPGRR